MRLSPTDDQLAIAAAARSFLESSLPIEPGAAAAGGAGLCTDELWRECAELGWFGLAVAEADGGVGYGLVESVFLFVELGRALTPGPFLATAVATEMAAGSSIGDDLLSGSVRAGLAEPDARGWWLTDDSCELVVVCRPDSCELHEIAPGSLRVKRSIDDLTPIGRLDAPTVGPIAASEPAERVYERALLRNAAVGLGLAQRALADSVAHVSAREQFGQPIGSFQTVRHRCSDMAVRAAVAEAQVWFAAASLHEERADATFQALSAMVMARPAAVANAADNIQNHGAIGFTAEHSAHLVATRAKVISTRLGGERTQLDLLAAADPPRL